jgi:hypothetical protein
MIGCHRRAKFRPTALQWRLMMNSRANLVQQKMFAIKF